MSHHIATTLKRILGAAVIMAMSAPAFGAPPAKSPLKVVYAFAGGNDSGANPFASLVQDAAGNFYGTTNSGGANGAGTVFKLTASGKESVVYSFRNSTDGGAPVANVILDSQLNIYGTTTSGGLGSCNCGVVFKIDNTGQQSVLHTFAGGSDGASPNGALVEDKHGNLYGTTVAGGGACNCGTVFKLTPDGTETVVYSFASGNDGANPYAGLLLDSHGNLFGATYQGGGACNCGTIFEIAATGGESVLYKFAGGTDGAFPQTTLTADKMGNLYGTTKFGGAGNGGTVFKLAPGNTENVLHPFLGGTDGASPYAGLAMDKNGNLFGTTQQGGSRNEGTVFEVSSTGQETVLYSFTAGKDGGQPFATVSPGKAGKLYGTTSENGAHGLGTVFALKYTK